MSSSEHLRLHQLSRFALDELDSAGRGAVEGHLAACEACKARLAELQLEQQRFLERAEVASQSVAILARLDAPARRAPRLASAGLWRPLALSLAAALLAVIALPSSFRSGEGGHPRTGVTRIKGEAILLETFLNTADGPKRVESGATLTSGDQIQFRYRAGGHRFLMILSIDGRAVSSLYPSEPGSSIAIEPDGLHLLEGSIILDEVVGPERIVALFSDRALSFQEIKQVVEAAKLGADPQRIEQLQRLEGIDPGIEQRTLLLHKD